MIEVLETMGAIVLLSWVFVAFIYISVYVVGFICDIILDLFF